MHNVRVSIGECFLHLTELARQSALSAHMQSIACDCLQERPCARARDWKITCGDFFLHVHYSTLVDGPIRSDWNISAGTWTLLTFQSCYALFRPFPDRRRGGLASIDRRDRSQFYIVLTTRRPTNLSKQQEELNLKPNGLQNRDRHL